MAGKTNKGISSLLVAVLFSLTGYAHDGYLTETFFLFKMNSNTQLLQWDSDLGQVTSRKSPSDQLLPFTLNLSRQVQKPEPAQLGGSYRATRHQSFAWPFLVQLSHGFNGYLSSTPGDSAPE